MLLSDLSQHSELLGLNLLAPAALVSRMQAARGAPLPSRIKIRVSEGSEPSRGRRPQACAAGDSTSSGWIIEAAACRQGLSLTSRMNDDVISLLRVRLEGPGHPLPAREAHGDTLEQSGERLAEFTGASLEDVGASGPLQAAMFHAALLYTELHQVDHVVMQVTPEKVQALTDLMGMQQVSQAGRPTVLMKLNLGFVRGQVRRHAGHLGDSRYPMLYKWFFLASEAAGVKQRISKLQP
jgi:hypothetical protein